MSTITYTYNGFGEAATVTYPSGRLVTYGFDGIGRTNSVLATLNGVTQTIIPPQASASFDQWGHRVSLAYQSGAVDQWGLDATNNSRLGHWYVLPKAGNPLPWVYQYDQDNRLDATGEWTWQNDSDGRLAAVPGQTHVPIIETN